MKDYPLLIDLSFKKDHPNCMESIPWKMIIGCEAQAQANHSQSLEKLAQRGGLGIREVYAVLKGLPWRKVNDMTDSFALHELEIMIEDFKEPTP